MRRGKARIRVNVYGGGISGLTAAHELALRGFEVHVYEKDHAWSALGNTEAPALGGLARTQYFHAASIEQEAASWNIVFKTVSRGHPSRESAAVFPAVWLQFDEREPSDLSIEALRAFAQDFQERFPQVARSGAGPLISIQAFYDPNAIKLQERAIPYGRAIKNYLAYFLEGAKEEKTFELPSVKDTIAGFKPKDETLKLIEVEEPRPADSNLGLPPMGRTGMRVSVTHTLLPGEHGYRYFPSYYRHLFDTMRRTPLFDAHGQPIRGSVADNLVPLPDIGIASSKRPPFVLSWKPLPQGDAMTTARRTLGNMESLGITSQDLLQFSLRIMRYMSTCPQRREAELEDISWWQYLEGHDARTGGKLYHYSPAFTELLQSSGRVLVALDGKWGDAHTSGNIYLQLLTDTLVPTPRSNGTLNGPTTESWFFHWRVHLLDLGVEFHLAELQSLELDGHGQLVPRLKEVALDHHAPNPALESDAALAEYHLVATDVISAQEITRQLPGIGVPGQLQGYTDHISTKPGAPPSASRDPRLSPGLYPWDRLQTLSGIQYFFDTELNIIDGYIYCVDAPWALSSITSPVAWGYRPIQRLNRYQSIVSIDIGSWRAVSPTLGKSAWESTPEELAREVWRQFCGSLASRRPGEPGFHPPDPLLVHIDEGLVFNSVNPTQARIMRNETPFLLPTVGDWKYRPGPEPWDPTPDVTGVSSRSEGKGALPPGLWQAPHGGYLVHWDKLVFAGTYNRTFTRLTTMESANESARHAVNAIIDHCIRRKTSPQEQPSPEAGGIAGESNAPLFATTPAGDYCRIWDPEKHELGDMGALQAADAKNFSLGLPHPWDLLGVELLPSLYSKLVGTMNPFAWLEPLLKELGQKVAPGGGAELLAVLRRIREKLEKEQGDRGYPAGDS